MDKKLYRQRLLDAQINLVDLQRHVIAKELRLLVLFEGRDSSGKDGVIKRIAEHQSPRETRVVALGKPSERDRSSWYFQRWTSYLPAQGETALFNRSWYNRAGVEPVMGFCSDAQYESFLADVGAFEKILTDDGLILLKYYLDISKGEQARRLEDRRQNPLKTWKISPIDAVAVEKWDDYSRARNRMLMETCQPLPWRVVRADNKRVARLTVINDILRTIDCGGYSRPVLGHDADTLQYWGRPDVRGAFLAP
ncbi:polyphosphate kinase 2 [Maricaulis sp.]|uniref:polyphosphate kinase 2 n=1 Tax=Maricaulis sp. TaxID=1486257 RepID=UPI002B271468|nr:polyphosphate kinase 2 [Maricaulis sp.]